MLNEQLEKFLKRLESQDYARSGVAGYRLRLSEFCAEVKVRGIPRSDFLDVAQGQARSV